MTSWRGSITVAVTCRSPSLRKNAGVFGSPHPGGLVRKILDGESAAEDLKPARRRDGPGRRQCAWIRRPAVRRSECRRRCRRRAISSTPGESRQRASRGRDSELRPGVVVVTQHVQRHLVIRLRSSILTVAAEVRTVSEGVPSGRRRRAVARRVQMKLPPTPRRGSGPCSLLRPCCGSAAR